MIIAAMSPELITRAVVRFAVGGILLADVALLIAWITGWRRGASFFGARWSLVHVFVAGQLAALAGLIGQFAAVVGLMLGRLVAGAAFHLARPRHMNVGDAGMALLVAASMVQDLVLAGAPLYLIQRRYGEPLAKYGIWLMPSQREVSQGIRLGLRTTLLVWLAGVFMVLELYSLLGKRGFEALSKSSSDLTINGVLSGHPGILTTAAVFVAGVVVAPLCEELFFRGLLYNAVKRRLGVTPALFISAAAFGLVHLGPLAVVGVFIMGYLFAQAYERTGSIWVPIIMHSTNNAIMICLSLRR